MPETQYHSMADDLAHRVLDLGSSLSESVYRRAAQTSRIALTQGDEAPRTHSPGTRRGRHGQGAHRLPRAAVLWAEALGTTCSSSRSHFVADLTRHDSPLTTRRRPWADAGA